MDASDALDAFSAAPLFIAYFAVTAHPWEHFVAFIGALVGACAMYCAYILWPGQNSFVTTPPPLANLQHWTMLLTEMCIFFIVSQGMGSKEMQPDGFQSSYMYVPIAIAWLNMTPCDDTMKKKPRLALILAKAAVSLLLIFYGVARDPSGKVPDIRPEIRWPTLILLSVLFILPSRDKKESKEAAVAIVTRLAMVVIASCALIPQEVRRMDDSWRREAAYASSPPIDYRVYRDITGDEVWLNYLLLPAVRAAILSCAGHYASKCVQTVSRESTVVSMSFYALLACIVANCNTHALLWAILSQLGVFLWNSHIAGFGTAT